MYLTALACQRPVRPQDSYVSSEAHAFVLLGSSKDFAGYLISLRMRQRCTVMAYNDRGALCVAVATADETPAAIIMHVCDYAHWAAGYILHQRHEAWH